jgi:hypothetical protein
VFAQVYCCKDCAKKKKRKTTQAVKTLFKGEKATLVLVTIKLLHQQTKKAQSEESIRIPESKKELTNSLEYQAQTSKSTRHGNCRA